MQQSSKRPRGTPTLLTPVRPHKRALLREIGHGTPKRLVFEPVASGMWRKDEISALVEFILIHCTDNVWPTHQRMKFWDQVGPFIKMRTKSENLRSGNE